MNKIFRHAVVRNFEQKQYFVKIYEGDTKKEYEKARKIWELAKNTDFFSTPEPLKLVESHSIIIWQHLPTLSNLREYLQKIRKKSVPDKDNSIKKVFSDCGRSLAAIHNKLLLNGAIDNLEHEKYSIHTGDDIVDRHVRSILENSSVKAIHGDFTCINICIPENSNEIVIVDSCSNNYLYYGVSTDARCCPYWEVALFVKSLFSNYKLYYPYRRKMMSFIDAFLDGYCKESKEKLDRTTVFACAATILKIYSDFLVAIDRERITIRKFLENYFRRKMVDKLFTRSKHEFGIRISADQ